MQRLPLVSFLFAFVLAIGISRGADPAPAPTTQEVKADFDAGKFQDVIKEVARAMAVRLPASSDADRATFLVLKAESHLRLKQYPLASDAFAAASKVATDPADIATDHAISLLIRKSPGGKFQPKPADPKSPRPPAIDIVDAASRKSALSAFFTDESKTVTARVETAKKQSALPPVMEAAKAVNDLKSLELAATGADATCRQMLTDLTAHAKTLMTSAITTMTTNVERIATAAAKETETTQNYPDGTSKTIVSKAGLNSNDRNALSDVSNTCKNIDQASDELAKALGAESTDFDAARADAKKLAARAEEVLSADYSSRVTAVNGGGTVTPRAPGGRPYR